MAYRVELIAIFFLLITHWWFNWSSSCHGDITVLGLNRPLDIFGRFDWLVDALTFLL
jgi:hypothetical protein